MTDTSTRRASRKRLGGCAIAGIVAALVLVIAAVAAGTAWQLLYRAENPVAPGQQVEFTVKRGQSVRQIGEALAEEGIVRNALMFRLQVRSSEQDGRLMPGTYSFATGMPYDIVLQKLVSGPDIITFDVTIPEGFTARQVAARFAKETGVPEAEMLDLVSHGAPLFEDEHPYLEGALDGALEGYLFPKTYKVKKGATSEAIVEMMLDQFDKETAGIDLSYAEKRNLDLGDIVTVASILERETKLSREYRLVASVIYNRLKLPMRLQLCATALYGLPEGTKVLSKADLEADTPWNTYARDGLPLTPICNPGIRAIQAAAKPKNTDYLYYALTGRDGSQTFSSNYRDHLKAAQKSRRLTGD